VIELNHIYNEDCLDTINRMEDGSIDLLLTDPPWVEQNNSTLARAGQETKTLRLLLRAAPRVCKRLIVILGNYCDPTILSGIQKKMPFVVAVPLRNIPPPYKGRILREYDMAYVYGSAEVPDGRKVFPGSVTYIYAAQRWESINHPCPRPLQHMQGLVAGFSNEGDVIYDPFAGSGTTLVAAKKLGRNWVGSEIDPKWIDAANARIATAREQTRLDI
jgi:DNA modification methylase